VTNISDRPLPPTEEEQEGGLSPQDICAIQQKIEEDKAVLEQEEHMVQPSLRTTHRRLATFDFGSHASEVSAQIYNKSLEIKKHRKEWFEPIWLANGWDGESEVWRIEFRFKRKFLNKFDLNEAFTVLQLCGLLWRYATEEWLRFVDLSQSQDTNTSRLPTHYVWQLVQQAYQLTHSDTGKISTLDPVAEREARLSHLVQTYPLQVIKQGSALVLNEELLSLYQYTPDDLARLVGWLPSLNTLFHARLWLAFLVDALELPDFLRLTRLNENDAALQATLDTGDLDPVTLRVLAREQLQQMTDAQVDQLLTALSPSTYTEVQTSLVKQSKRLAKLDTIIASLAGFMRSAVALAPLDEIGEISSLTGQRVRQPDLYSDMLWLLDKVREYDEKKQRSHPDEVWKKRLLYGFKTAAELEEERRLYGVELAPQDWTSLDLALYDLRSASSSDKKQQCKNNGLTTDLENDDCTDIA
jgi:hypothetical protein